MILKTAIYKNVVIEIYYIKCCSMWYMFYVEWCSPEDGSHGPKHVMT
jgi:hypothetical protein